MIFIKPYTKKLLKDLDNPDLWEDSFLCVKHKEERFEVWYSALHTNMIFGEKIEFNLLERMLIAKKVKKLKRYFVSKEDDAERNNIPKYFKV